MTDPDPDRPDPAHLGAAVAEARAGIPDAQVVFVSVDDVDARHEEAAAVAAAAGLRPWPDWTLTRVGSADGPHLLGVVADLADTGRSTGVVICALGPVDGALLDQAAAVVADGGDGPELAVAVIDDAGRLHRRARP